MNTMIMLVMPTLTQLEWASFLILLLVVLEPLVLGAVFIRERQVGVVVKKLGIRSLPPGHLIALAVESGYQSDTLPPGLHFGYFRWQYLIFKLSVTVVPQGGIALVV